MTDFTALFDELKKRTDDGGRFYREVIENGEYKEALGHIGEGVILDIGAHIGTFDYFIYNEALLIYSVEASIDNYNTLVNYKTKYNLDKIRPFHLAIAGANGERNLYDGASSGGFSIWEGSGRDSVEMVQAKTVNTFLVEQGINHVDILKIDVERAEDEIFKGDDFKEAAEKIAFIIGENHGWNLRPTIEGLGFVFHDHGQNFFATK